MLFTADQALGGGGHQQLHTSFFVAPSGAGVFATGTNRWTDHLDGPEASSRVQMITTAVLRWMVSH